MKNFLKISFLALFILTLATNTFAQKKIKKGVVTYEITDVESDMPEVAMIKGTEMEVSFASAKQKMDVKIMGGLIRVQTILDSKNTADNTVLMDMMGQKIQLTGMSPEDMKNNPLMNMAGAGGNTDNANLKLTYDKKDKKKIAGYKCHKASATPTEGMEMIFYVTKKIQPENSYFEQMANGLEGYPLQFIINTGMGISLTFTAQEVKGELAQSAFTIPNGYKQMTLEEFQEEMGGMNLGF